VGFFYGSGFFQKEKPLCHFICLLMVLRAQPTHKLPKDFFDE
jgi:signal transduction histidine kinase